MSVTIPLWAMLAALAVVVVVAAGVGAARSPQARGLLGPWVYDRRQQAQEPVRAARVVRGGTRDQVGTPAHVRVLPAGRGERADGERP